VLGQRSGNAFTPVAPPSRQRSRAIVRQHSSDNIIPNNNTIKMVGVLFLIFVSFASLFYLFIIKTCYKQL